MKRITTLFLTMLALSLPTQSFGAVRERASTQADHQSLNLTVYNDGTALIHDRRRVSLDAGLNRIAWRDVSANMEPTSAILDDLDQNASASVLEQNFNYDVLDQDSLLRNYVGRVVTIVHPARFAGERDVREPARILTMDNGIVLQYRDRIETTLNGYVEFPAIPPSLRDRPTLTLDIQSGRSGPHLLDLQYLSGGLTWHVDYVGTLSRDESKMALTGLVTLANASGTSFRDARLQLVAGSVHTVPARAGLKMIAHVVSAVRGDIYHANVAQENYFEYHLYTLPRPTTILDKQTKQLLLLGARDIPVKKTLELRGQPNDYFSADSDLGAREPVGVYVSFENRGGDLGIPLPAGSMRIYEDDSHGLAQFVGSDAIAHTPRNGAVRLYLGNSFDLVARKRQTNYRLISKCSNESSYAIDFTNGKDMPQDVTVIEPIPGDWRIESESEPHVKSSASTATWIVHVPADGKATLAYAAAVSWCR
ncbi:MAG TPA: hypothetical protein VNF68_09230 [Candidatus Baltobacteraceae bacterium]|nr:hypothetical protein [Candidatus Baltobacteraceae bacterium]